MKGGCPDRAHTGVQQCRRLEQCWAESRAYVEVCMLTMQMLRNMPDAPQLPACYPAMMILALCPPLFHRIMDPRVAAYSKPTSRMYMSPKN